MKIPNFILAIGLGIFTFIVAQGLLTVFLKSKGYFEEGGISDNVIKAIALGLCLVVTVMTLRKGG